MPALVELEDVNDLGNNLLYFLKIGLFTNKDCEYEVCGNLIFYVFLILSFQFSRKCHVIGKHYDVIKGLGVFRIMRIKYDSCTYTHSPFVPFKRLG